MRDVAVEIPVSSSLADALERDEHLPGGSARIWTTGRPGLVLGLRDTRLPHAEEAARAMAGRGWEVHVRASGGRLVVQDPGVLNVALAYAGEDLPSLERLFAEMTDLLCTWLAGFGLGVEQGMVEGSICAGASDLAIAGQKVAGVSQRRRRTFALVHAFVLVGGTGDERVVAAHDFYALAGAGPSEGVRTGTMVSLGDVLADPLTVSDAARSLAEKLAP